MARMLHAATQIDYEPLVVCPMCPDRPPAARPDDRFCEECGTVLVRAARRKVICSCTPGRALVARYCPTCGTSTDLLVQRHGSAEWAEAMHEAAPPAPAPA